MVETSASAASTNSSTENDTCSVEYIEDSSAKETFLCTRNLSPSRSRDTSSALAKDGTVTFDKKKKEASALSRVPAFTARKYADHVPFRAAVRSQTIDFVQGLVQAFSRIADVKRDTISRERKAKEARRRRLWSFMYSECLEDRLKLAVEMSCLSEKKFLPKSQLHELVTQTSVDGELLRWKRGPRFFIKTQKRPYSIQIETKNRHNDILQMRRRSTSELLRQEAEKTYRKIFAILTYIGRAPAIWHFVDEEVCDADLPLIKSSAANATNHCFKLQGRQTTKSLRCFGDWEDGIVAKFVEHQWIFLAPSFTLSNDPTVIHHNFQPEEILPFTHWAKEAKSGGSGEVFKASLHNDHRVCDKAKVRFC